MAKAIPAFGLCVGGLLVISAMVHYLNSVSNASPGAENWTGLFSTAIAYIVSAGSVLISISLAIGLLIYSRFARRDENAIILYYIAFVLNLVATACWTLQTW